MDEFEQWMRLALAQAETALSPCRRCKADLSLLFALEGQRAAALAGARAALARGRYAVALASARRADQLRRDAESLQVLAVAALLAGDHAGAWSAFAAAQPPALPR